MGFILDQTPEMGEYGGEVRRESFYLRGEDTYDYAYNGAPLPRHVIIQYPQYGSSGRVATAAGTVEILLEDIPKIRAVLDAVEAHAARR
jgi:hypothetical protein